MGFLDSSVGKEPACNAGDLGSIPGLGRSPGERIGYPLQYSWTSLVVQLGKNLPAMRETWVWSLGWEDPLEKGKAPHTNILAWRIPWTVESMESWRAGHNWAIYQKKKKKKELRYLVEKNRFSYPYMEKTTWYLLLFEWKMNTLFS